MKFVEPKIITSSATMNVWPMSGKLAWHFRDNGRARFRRSVRQNVGKSQRNMDGGMFGGHDPGMVPRVSFCRLIGGLVRLSSSHQVFL